MGGFIEVPALLVGEAADQGKPDAVAGGTARLGGCGGRWGLGEVEMGDWVRAEDDGEAGGRGMLEGIAQQIAEEHEKDFAVSLDGGFGRDGENGLEAAVREEDLLFCEGFADEFHEALRAAFGAAAFLAGHDQKGSGNAFQSLTGALEPCEQFRSGWGFLLHEAESPAEHGERGAQFMGTIGDELAFAFKGVAFALPCVIEGAGELSYFIGGAWSGERSVIEAVLAHARSEVDHRGHGRAGKAAAEQPDEQEGACAYEEEPLRQPRSFAFRVFERLQVDEPPDGFSGRRVGGGEQAVLVLHAAVGPDGQSVAPAPDEAGPAAIGRGKDFMPSAGGHVREGDSVLEALGRREVGEPWDARASGREGGQRLAKVSVDHSVLGFHEQLESTEGKHRREYDGEQDKVPGDTGLERARHHGEPAWSCHPIPR